MESSLASEAEFLSWITFLVSRAGHNKAAVLDLSRIEGLWMWSESVATSPELQADLDSRRSDSQLCAAVDADGIRPVSCDEDLGAFFAAACVEMPHHCSHNLTMLETHKIIATPASGQCFSFLSGSYSFAEAEAACQSHGAHGLASVQSNEDVAFLKNYLPAISQSAKSVWVGARVQSDGAVVWKDDTAGLTDSVFQNEGESQCGMLQYDELASVVSATACSQEGAALCGLPNSPCPTGWLRSPVSGACIRFFSEKRTFQAAKSACDAQYSAGQSFMWTPHDPLEVGVVAQVWKEEGWIGVESDAQGAKFLDNSEASNLLDPTKTLSGSWLKPVSALFRDCESSAQCFAHIEGSRRQTGFFLDLKQDIVAESTLLYGSAPGEERAFFCEFQPACSEPNKDELLEVFPGSSCRFPIDNDVQFVEFEIWGAGGQSSLLEGKTSLGGAGGYASGAIKVRTEKYFAVEVGGVKHQWDFSFPGQAQAEGFFIKAHSGGGRSAMLFPARPNQPVDFHNEVAVAGGGGGAGTEAGGNAVAFNERTGGSSAFEVAGGRMLIATGGRSATQTSVQGVDGAGGDAGIAGSSSAISMNACSYGSPGLRNTAGIPLCSSVTNQLSGGGGGGGYFGGGSGVAVSSSTVSGGGGGSGHVHPQVIHGALIGGDSRRAPRQESEHWARHFAQSGAGQGAFRAKLHKRPLRCWPDTKFVLTAPGTHFIETPAGALSFDSAMWGAGGSPAKADLGSESNCAGGLGGYASARIRSFPTNPIFISIGRANEKYSDYDASVSLPHSGLGGTVYIPIDGYSGSGVGMPVGSDGSKILSRGGGGATVLWAITRFDPWLIAGGGGGGSGHAVHSSSLCARGGHGGGVDGASGQSILGISGGQAGSAVEGGAGGTALPSNGYNAFGADGQYARGGSNQAICQVHEDCFSFTPDGGDGLWGGGAGASNANAVSGAGGGSSYFSADQALTAGYHPQPQLIRAAGYTPVQMNDWRRFALRGSESGQGGMAVLEFRCTDCDDALQCSIADETGAAQCYDRQDQKPAQFPGDIHSQCFHCDPSDEGGYRMWSQRATGGSCDDGLDCTTNDACSSKGLCQGELYECFMFQFTNDPSKDCEECEGNGQCRKRDDYSGAIVGTGASRACGCLIGGEAYAHNDVNPDYPYCQFCDVTQSATEWSFRANGLQCDDAMACTFSDVCVAGHCVGTEYSCAIQECHSSYECNGRGGCAASYKQLFSDAACGKQVLNECQLSPVCDGNIATCPGYSTSQPVVSPALKPAAMQVLQVANHPHSFFLRSDDLTATNEILSSVNGLLSSVTEFDVACDELRLSIGTMKITEAADAGRCETSLVDRDALEKPIFACPDGWRLHTDATFRNPLCIHVSSLEVPLADVSKYCKDLGGIPINGVRNDAAISMFHTACAQHRGTCWTGLNVTSGRLSAQVPLWGVETFLLHKGWLASLDGPLVVQGHHEAQQIITVGNSSSLNHVMCERQLLSCPVGWQLAPSELASPVCVQKVGIVENATRAQDVCHAAGGRLLVYDQEDDLLIQIIGAECSVLGCWLIPSSGDVPAINAAHAQAFLPCDNCANILSSAGQPIHNDDQDSAVAICTMPVFVCPHNYTLIALSSSGVSCVRLVAGNHASSLSSCQSAGGDLVKPGTAVDLLQLAALCQGRNESCRTGLRDKSGHGGVSTREYSLTGFPSEENFIATATKRPEGSCVDLVHQANRPMLQWSSCSAYRNAFCSIPPHRCSADKYAVYDSQSASFICEDTDSETIPQSWGASGGGSVWIAEDLVVEFKQAQTDFARWVGLRGYNALKKWRQPVMQVPKWFQLQHGSSYKLVASVTNVQGDSLVSCSDAFSIDNTPPALTTSAGVWEVRKGSLASQDATDVVDIDFQSLNTLSFQWSGFFDPDSSFDGVLEYHFCVTDAATSSAGCQLSSEGRALGEWRQIAPTGSYEYRELGLIHGQSYRVHIMAYNRARLFSLLSSDGTVYDATAPLPSLVLDRTHLSLESDARYTNDSSLVEFSWVPFEEAESYIVEYTIQIGTIVGRPTDNFMSEVALSANSTSFTYQHDEDIPSGTTLYAALTALNSAGLEATRMTNGIIIDTTTPVVAAILLPSLVDSNTFWRSVQGGSPTMSINSTAIAGSRSLDMLRILVQFDDEQSCFHFCSLSVQGQNALTQWNDAVPDDQLEPGTCSTEMPFSVALKDAAQAGPADLLVKCQDRSGNVGFSNKYATFFDAAAPSCGHVTPVSRAVSFPTDFSPNMTDGNLQGVIVCWQSPDSQFAAVVSTWVCVTVDGSCVHEVQAGASPSILLDFEDLSIVQDKTIQVDVNFTFRQGLLVNGAPILSRLIRLSPMSPLPNFLLATYLTAHTPLCTPLTLQHYAFPGQMSAKKVFKLSASNTV